LVLYSESMFKNWLNLGEPGRRVLHCSNGSANQFLWPGVVELLVHFGVIHHILVWGLIGGSVCSLFL